MTLSFRKTFPNGDKTYFIDKIWHSLLTSRGNINSIIADRHYENHVSKFGYGWDLSTEDPFPKHHTIRLDPHDRWKPGVKIHPVINNRTKNRFQFAPVMECVSVQKITIRYHWGGIAASVRVDGRLLKEDEIEKLALNDGFPTVEAFFQYFNQDFKGVLIHFTDLKY